MRADWILITSQMSLLGTAEIYSYDQEFLISQLEQSCQAYAQALKIHKKHANALENHCKNGPQQISITGKRCLCF